MSGADSHPFMFCGCVRSRSQASTARVPSRSQTSPNRSPAHLLSPGSGVVVDVHAAGVSFPEVLQTRGLYQFKPELPFVPGSEVSGTVRAASEGTGFEPGDRVAPSASSAAWRRSPSRRSG